MIPEVGILTIIGLVLMLALYFVKSWYEHNNETKRLQDEEDKRIDSFTGADDIMRGSK